MAPKRQGNDMTWTHHTLKFRLLSPMHIGYRKVGNLMQTRQYVPGKNIWAALTARLTRDYHDGSQGKCYQRIGDLIKLHFRFGYLWPSLDGKDPYFPWVHNDFDYQLLNSYASTALDYTVNSALEGSLHETEYIAHVARNTSQVFMLGDLWVKATLPEELHCWKKEMNKLQLGGERAYGWGRVFCCSDLNDGHQEGGITVSHHKWEGKGGKIVLTLDKNDKIKAHVLASGPEAATSLTGPIEPLVGRNWGEHAGQNISFEKVHFSPGCEIETEHVEFELGWDGRWKCHRR
ncbi:hypothetical protein [Candidatus Methanocrinis natronophilus]|uniref:Uncharacterized protein n=1 Tax=Candidatus Methanocrinis natronophilus TaxID=3033396 RepID=A0ABT5X8F2_9EURY|nr:hypothetical protein [Candidatus Methanocrinis natronophilus]MDF0590979.1 hypothetical protein [Candidatus Methanocrinis natronophilus]